MGIFPWRDRQSDRTHTGVDDTMDDDPLIACEFQDAILAVYEDGIHINRNSASRFSDKWIPDVDVLGVRYEKRFVISYLQIQQRGFDNATGSMLSTPVDANTLHFGRGKRDCAKEAEEVISEQLVTASSE